MTVILSAVAYYDACTCPYLAYISIESSNVMYEKDEESKKIDTDKMS